MESAQKLAIDSQDDRGQHFVVSIAQVEKWKANVEKQMRALDEYCLGTGEIPSLLFDDYTDRWRMTMRKLVKTVGYFPVDFVPIDRWYSNKDGHEAIQVAQLICEYLGGAQNFFDKMHQRIDFMQDHLLGYRVISSVRLRLYYTLWALGVPITTTQRRRCGLVGLLEVLYLSLP
jgi:hypothetical protein